MRVAVLGAGYAGLTLARELETSLPDAAELVVVDESDTHLVQHELHRLLRRPELAAEITLPLSDLFDRATVRQARIEDVDPESGTATLADGTDLEYDVGAVCLGAETAFYDLPGVREHSTPMKRVEHAERAREEYLDVLEDRGESGRVVVGGAGLSGVQVAGELAAMAADREVDPEIVLLERLDSVAPSFPENFQRAVHEELVDRGVTVRTGTAVEGADEEHIALATGEDIAYDQFLWTGGIRGPAALATERPVVRSDLRLAGDTFAVGDAARVVDVDGTAVPASAQAAVREASVAATNVTRLVEHRLDGGGFEPRLDRYEFDSPGWLVSVGDGAVAQVGSTVLRGRAALALKTSVGAGYLGSVGAVENAVDLVRQELALGPDDGREDASDGGTHDGDADG